MRISTFNAGAPSFAAFKGTLCLDTTGGNIYVNTDGSTTWALWKGA